MKASESVPNLHIQMQMLTFNDSHQIRSLTRNLTGSLHLNNKHVV